MAAFDGKTFISLDEEGFGSGTTDTRTLPLSTYKENRIDANNRHLVRNSHFTGQVHREDVSNPRVMGSVIWGCRYLQRVFIQENDDLLRIYMDGDVEGTVEVRAQLYVFDDTNQLKEVSSFVATKEWHEDDDEWYIDIDTSVLPVYLPNASVGIWTRSIEDRATVANVTDGSVVWASVASGADAFRADTLYSPFDDRYYVYCPEKEVAYDGILKKDLTKEDGSIWVPLQSEDNDSPLASVTSPSWQVILMSYIQPSAWTLETFRDPTLPTERYSAKDRNTMLAQQGVLGQHCAQHGILLNTEYTKDRIVAQGCTEGVEEDSIWSDYGKWKRVDAGGAGVETFDTIGFRIDHETATVNIVGNLFGLNVNGEGKNNVADTGAVTNEYLNKYFAQVTVRAVISQLQAGNTDWTDVIERESVLNVGWWRTAKTQTRPLLRMFHFAYHNDVYDDTVSPGEIDFQFQDDPNFHFKEGSFLDLADGESDLQYYTPFYIGIPMSGVDTTKPFRLSLEMDQVSTANMTGPDILDFDVARLKLYLTSYSVTVRGTYE